MIIIQQTRRVTVIRSPKIQFNVFCYKKDKKNLSPIFDYRLIDEIVKKFKLFIHFILTKVKYVLTVF